MKQNNQSLDDFLRSSVEEAEFSYKEDYWVKMSAILDDEENKKRGFPFWRGLSMLLVLLAIGVGVYLFPKLKHETKSNAQAVSTSQPVASQQQSMLPSVNQDQPVSNNTNTSNETAPVSTSNGAGTETNSTTSNLPANSSNPVANPVTNQHINSSSTTPSAQQADQTAASSTSNGTQVPTNQRKSSPNPTPNTNSVSGSTAQHSHSSSSTQIHTNGNTTQLAKNNSADIGDIEPGNQTTKSSPAANETTVPHKKGNKNPKHGPAIANSTHSVNPPPISKKDEQHPDTKASVISSNAGVINSAGSASDRVRNGMHAVDTAIYQGTPARDHTLDNPRYIASLSDYIPTRIDSITVITYQPDPAVVSVKVNEARNVSETPAAYSRAISFMLNAGLNANKGFKGNVENPISWAFAPYLGVGIDKPFSSKLTLSSHVGFTYFNGLNSELKVNSYHYGFGLDSSSVSILSKKMLQLYLPVSVYYEVIKNHYLMAAIGAMYSLDVSSKVTERSVSNNTGTPSINSKMATTTTTTESGYRSGYNQFDMFAQIGYSYKVNNALMFQLAFQQGFFDMTKNSYFNNNLNNTQTRLSLGLKYNFKRN